MARCKGCIHDKVCNRDVGHGYSICPHYIDTADVVPKSEVERLQKDIEGYKHLEVILNTAVDKLRKELEAEVAREIFAEIERGIAEQYPIYSAESIRKLLTELKKKYTEGTPK